MQCWSHRGEHSPGMSELRIARKGQGCVIMVRLLQGGAMSDSTHASEKDAEIFKKFRKEL